MSGSTTVTDIHDADGFRPCVRADALVRRYGNEAVAWSPLHRYPTSMDPVAALVFQLLDGSASVAELVTDVHEVVGIPQSIAHNQLMRVLSQLHDAGLLLTSAADVDPDAEPDLFPAPPNP